MASIFGVQKPGYVTIHLWQRLDGLGSIALMRGSEIQNPSLKLYNAMGSHPESE